MRKLIALALLILVSGCSEPPSPPAAQPEEPPGPPLPFAECVKLAVAHDAEALRGYHRDLQELIVSDDPENEALATLGMKFQLAQIDQREARLLHLLGSDPSRIRIDDGFYGLTRFEWNDEDGTALNEADPEQRRIADEIAGLAEQYEAHPRRTLFAEYFRTNLALTREYEQIAARRDELQERVDRTLKRCEPLGHAGPS